MARDRDILRALAGRLRQAADDPEMARRRQLWRAHNALSPAQPMILCFPEGSWDELVSDRDCRCRDPQLRRWELTLRRRVFACEQIGDDQPVEPYFDLNWRVEVSDFGVNIPRVEGDNRGSFVWDPPIKNLDRDFAKLRPRTFRVDRDATQRDLERADAMFGDLLTPRLRGSFWWTVGLTQTLVYLIGIEPLMYAMIDQPQAVHRLMAFLRDDMARFMDFTERERLLTPAAEGQYVGSGGLAYTDELPAGDPAANDPVSLADRWGFAESQETVGVSPAMFAEFIMPYQQPLLDRFGLNCYGCCEGLEHRIDVVMRDVPRLRRVSVAPKADQATLASKLAGRCIFSRKADPVPVCVGFNERAIAADIRHTLDVARGQPLEIILKDTHTVQHEPWRLGRWVRIAREQVDRL